MLALVAQEFQLGERGLDGRQQILVEVRPDPIAWSLYGRDNRESQNLGHGNKTFLEPIGFTLVAFAMSHIVSVFRKAHFNAAHRLHVPEWSAEENRAFFGLCNNEHFHGHNYDLEVKVTGQVDPVSGYLIDMKLLQQFINEEVVEPFDHKNLNMDTDDFRQLNPTAENIVWVIWKRLRSRIPAEMDVSVRLYETPRNFVEYNG
jgi:6-pyruvoyltetrahydropterin/6-carboxytetrahydropterin synthase